MSHNNKKMSQNAMVYAMFFANHCFCQNMSQYVTKCHSVSQNVTVCHKMSQCVTKCTSQNSKERHNKSRMSQTISLDLKIYTKCHTLSQKLVIPHKMSLT